MLRPLQMLVIVILALLAVTSALWFFVDQKECTESWKCTEWSACINGQQTRSCLDEQQCDTTRRQPALSQSCGEGIPPEPGQTPEPSWRTIDVALGQEEIVIDWSTERCEDYDLPDVFVHAVRNYEGKIVLAAGNAPKNYWMFGPDFNHLKKNCMPVLVSGDRQEAGALDHQEWVTSIYTNDGKTIYGLVHNEYHDPFSDVCKQGDTTAGNPCWYNFVSAAVSTNGGYTFSQLPSPQHIVAMLPFQWDPDSAGEGRRGSKTPQPHGYMEPSNIIKGKDNYYYAIVRVLNSPTDASKRGACLMRTNNLDNPSSWKFWDGQDFTIPRVVPYPNEPQNPEQYECAYIGKDIFDDFGGSLTYNTYFERYMLIGSGVYEYQGNSKTCGEWFSLSEDLIQWTKPQLLRKSPLPFPPCTVGAAPGLITEAYASLIDHTDTTRSFEHAGQQAYLYFMRNNGVPESGYLDRDLIRVPVTFTKK